MMQLSPAEDFDQQELLLRAALAVSERTGKQQKTKTTGDRWVQEKSSQTLRKGEC